MAPPVQPSFADLGTPLHAVTFVVVDLETTGGSCHDCRITEFGAVKVRAGEVLGEFQSLVDPGQAIPPSISALTGITDAMVAQRPPVEAVLPAFLEFCAGSALVAHNAGFDISFLNAGLARLSYPRLTNPVLCTASLARRLVRDEVRNCKLATLAQHFRCRTTPIHRALADARATVEVLHGLLERAGSFGVLTLEDLIGFSRAGSAPLYASRRRLADDLPSAPGVYAFRSASGEILYVGKATDLRSRVRSYFGNDSRRKIASMMKETDRVDHWVCATAIEASVREVRLIQQHRPRFNRRSKRPEKRVYLRLTRERFPRLSVVRAPPLDGSAFVGPLASRSVAEQVAEAVAEAVPIRRCTTRIGARTRFEPCALAAMGRCLSPCDGSVDPDTYDSAVATVRAAFAGDPSAIAVALTARMTRLAAQGRFEEAASTRDRLRALLAAVRSRHQRDAVARTPLLIVSRPARRGTVEVAAIRRGVLLASAPATADTASEVAAQLRADTVAASNPAPTSGTAAISDAAPTSDSDGQDVDIVLQWLDADGAVVHHCDGIYASTTAGGAQLASMLQRVAAAQRGTGRPAAELAAKRRRRDPAVPADLPTAVSN